MTCQRQNFERAAFITKLWSHSWPLSQPTPHHPIATITTAPQPGACLSVPLCRHVFIRIPAPLHLGPVGEQRRESRRGRPCLRLSGHHQLLQHRDSEVVPHEHVARKAEVKSEQVQRSTKKRNIAATGVAAAFADTQGDTVSVA